MLLKACSQLLRKGRDIRLKIAGDGPERPCLEKMADELGLRTSIEFLGSVDREAIEQLLTEVIAVVMPSVCEDVAGLVALEVMMQGRLIIATDIGGLAEMVDGVGLTFPPGDSGALECCMCQVLENPALVKDLEERAQIRASQLFAAERMIEAHLRVYRSLLPSHPA